VNRVLVPLERADEPSPLLGFSIWQDRTASAPHHGPRPLGGAWLRPPGARSWRPAGAGVATAKARLKFRS